MPQISVATFMAGFVFGVFGWFILKHGRHEANGKRMALGLLLMTYGLVVPNAWANWGIGILLVAINYYAPWMN